MPEKRPSERRSIRPISDPYRYMAPAVIARGPTEAELAKATWVRDCELRRSYILQKIADCAGLHKYCRRKNCRRKRACDHDQALCLHDFHSELSVAFFPALRKAVKKRQEELERLGYDPSLEQWPPKPALDGGGKQGASP